MPIRSRRSAGAERGKGWKDNGLRRSWRWTIIAAGGRAQLCKGFGFSIKVYMIDLSGATDISRPCFACQGGNAGHPGAPQPVMDMRAFGLTPDNIEGMTPGQGQGWQRPLDFGVRNNFSPEQKTQFLRLQGAEETLSSPSACHLPEMAGLYRATAAIMMRSCTRRRP